MSSAVPRTVPELQAALAAGLAPDFVFFWNAGPPTTPPGSDCLSQWYMAPFEVEGVRYLTAEHFMMAAKARHFHDEATLAAILAADHPSEAKKLGREVQNFNSAEWATVRYERVVQGNLAKFTQNPALRDFLVQTNPQILVEASPEDKIWGIGLTQEDARATQPAEWLGLNLMGFALMEVRHRLLSRKLADKWLEQDNALTRTFHFPDFKTAFAFMTDVAAVAERLDHHPWMASEYRTVEFRLRTHDAGNTVTKRDHRLAAEIDMLAKQYAVD